jgi:hypothetical protein
MWWIKRGFNVHESANELKIHFVEMFGQALHGLVYYRHVQGFFIMLLPLM